MIIKLRLSSFSVNDIWILVTECMDIFLFTVLLLVYEKKTRSKGWAVTKLLFRILYALKVLDDIVHMVPAIVKGVSGSVPSFLVSNLSLYVSPIIRGIVLFMGIR